MPSLRLLLDRVVPALLMATSVVLLSAGIFAYAQPAGDAVATPTAAPGDPAFVPSPPPGLPSPDLLPSPRDAPTLPPVLAPSASPGATASPFPTAVPTPTAGPTPTPAERAWATRIVVPSLNIDLAVVPGDLDVPGNRDSYPLCDVAQYLLAFRQPGEPGTTYIYAHARRGMFLPLLRSSEVNDGAGMIGSLVEVYTSANRLHLYEIYRVKRHATDLSLAFELPPDGQQLVLQTSEGPAGTIPKLQVAARLLDVVPADPRQANPRPNPRACPP